MKAISSSEWAVLRVIWTLGRTDSSKLIDILSVQHGWQASTIKTLLRRLIDKNYVTSDAVPRNRHYWATVSEDDLMQEQLTQLLSDMCAMKRGTAIVNSLEKLPLPQSDIINLQALLVEKAKTAEPFIACDCLPDHCNCSEMEENHGE